MSSFTFTSHRSSSTGRFVRVFGQILFSFLLIYRNITTPCHVSSFETIKNFDHGSFDLNSPIPNFNKFSHFGLLCLSSSSDPTRKPNHKLNIFSPKFPPLDHKNSHCLSIFLILAGIETNPGPRAIKWPCGACAKSVFRTNCVQCDECDKWFHADCLQWNSETLESIKNLSWYCDTCSLPKCTSSFFKSSSFGSLTSKSSSHDSNFSLPQSTFNTSNPSEATIPQPNPISASTPKKNPRATSDQTQSKFPNSLNFLIINFQSLWKKRVELANTASESKADIIIGTETWLSPDTKNSELLLDEFDIFRRDRPSRGGGVLIAVRKSLGCEQISQSKDSETIFCKIKLKNRKPLIIGSIYRPPNYDFLASQKIIEEIYSLSRRFKGAVFWLGGDFNIPDINWKNQDILGNQYDKEINK